MELAGIDWPDGTTKEDRWTIRGVEWAQIPPGYRFLGEKPELLFNPYKNPRRGVMELKIVSRCCGTQLERFTDPSYSTRRFGICRSCQKPNTAEDGIRGRVVWVPDWVTAENFRNYSVDPRHDRDLGLVEFKPDS